MERCTSCQYYDRHNGRSSEGKAANAGQCRRAAPALSPINQKSYMIEGVWPTVRDDDWCGEWKPTQRRMDSGRLAEALAAAPRGTVPPARPSGLPPSPARGPMMAFAPTLSPGSAGADVTPLPTAITSIGRAD